MWFWTLLNCWACTSGPWVVAGSRGSPSHAADLVDEEGHDVSTWLSCTSSRLGAWQDWPVLEKPRWMFHRAAFSRSPSVSTMFADLPPSSRQTRLTVCAAASPTLIPAPVEPVNETMSTSGWTRQGVAHDAAAADDQVEHARRRARLVHDLGQRHARGGEASDGLSTIVQPAAMP